MMSIKNTLTLLALCTCLTTVQEQTALIEQVDSMLEARREKSFAQYDTAYIGKPGGKWTVKLRANASGTNLYTDGTINNSQFNAQLESELRATAGVTVSYRGLSLGFAVNPAKLAGRSKDNEFSLSSYGNRMGVDIVYTSAKTFSGEAEYGGNAYSIEQGRVEMDVLQANAYYVFSHRRFSFPAAFSQSQVQKRSCGSWLLGLSAFAGRISSATDVVQGIGSKRLTTINVAIGGGYAYNFVIKRKWLLHLSVMPHIVVFSHNRLTVGDTRQHAPYRFPSLINVGRVAAVRNFKNSFIGMSAVVNLWRQGDKDDMLIENVKWRARLFYGVRF